MKKLAKILLICFFSICMLTTTAFAVDFGFYINYSLCTGDDIEYEGQRSWKNKKFDTDVLNYGVGFILDTAPASKRLFNYRLKVGYSRLKHDFSIYESGRNYGNYNTYSYEGTYAYNGIAVDNIFGFAVIRKPGFRWWIGPAVNCGYYIGDSVGTVTQGVRSYNNQGSITRSDFKDSGDLFTFGIGGITGMNFKITNTDIIVSPSIGLRYVYHFLEAEGGSFEFPLTISCLF